MIFYGVNLLHCVVELDSLGALVAAEEGFLVFKWSLNDMLFGVVLKHFSRFVRRPGAMKHACIFCNVWRVYRMAYIDFLVLDSAALLGVVCRGGSSSLFLPTKTFTVSFCQLGIFVRCSSFVCCFSNFHALENIL